MVQFHHPAPKEESMKLEIGDVVRKKKGYSFTGEVRAVFTNMTGQERIVVELLNSGGLLHIFSPGDVEPIQNR